MMWSLMVYRDFRVDDDEVADIDDGVVVAFDVADSYVVADGDVGAVDVADSDGDTCMHY